MSVWGRTGSARNTIESVVREGEEELLYEKTCSWFSTEQNDMNFIENLRWKSSISCQLKLCETSTKIFIENLHYNILSMENHVKPGWKSSSKIFTTISCQLKIIWNLNENLHRKSSTISCQLKIMWNLNENLHWRISFKIFIENLHHNILSIKNYVKPQPKSTLNPIENHLFYWNLNNWRFSSKIFHSNILLKLQIFIKNLHQKCWSQYFHQSGNTLSLALPGLCKHVIGLWQSREKY
jgi:hypothetical protein